MADPIALAEWQDEVERRGKLDCKFVCPVCGNAASPNDWKAKLPGTTSAERAVQECIGRAMPRDQRRRAFPYEAEEEEGLPERPCDYAAFGLIDVCKTSVKLPDGKILPVFEFAEVER